MTDPHAAKLRVVEAMARAMARRVGVDPDQLGYWNGKDYLPNWKVWVPGVEAALTAAVAALHAEGAKITTRRTTVPQLIEYWRATPEQAEMLHTNLGALKWLAMHDAAPGAFWERENGADGEEG